MPLNADDVAEIVNLARVQDAPSPRSPACSSARSPARFTDSSPAPEIWSGSPGLVEVGKTNEVGAGERSADLLHRAARDQIAQVDGEEARVLEQCAYLGLSIQVVA